MNKKKEKLEEEKVEGNPVDLLTIGSAIKTTKEVHKTTSGTKAVLVNISEEGERPEYGFAFPNGKYFEVDKEMIDEFFDLSTIWNVPELIGYKFKDKETLLSEFRKGVFNSTWK